jgi:hypothetical protein
VERPGRNPARPRPKPDPAVLLIPESLVPEPPINRRKEAALAFIAPAAATAATAAASLLRQYAPETAWLDGATLTAAGAGVLAVVVTTCMGAVARRPFAVIAVAVLMTAGQLAVAYTVAEATRADRGVEVVCTVSERRDYISDPPRNSGPGEPMTEHLLVCGDWPSFEAHTPRGRQLWGEVTAVFDPGGDVPPRVGDIGWEPIALGAAGAVAAIALALLIRVRTVGLHRRAAR